MTLTDELLTNLHFATGYAQKDDTRRGIFPRSCVEELSGGQSHSNHAVFSKFAAVPPTSESSVGSSDGLHTSDQSDDGASQSRAIDTGTDSGTDPGTDTDTDAEPPTLGATAAGVSTGAPAAPNWNAASGDSDWLSELSSRLGSLEGSFGELDTQ